MLTVHRNGNAQPQPWLRGAELPSEGAWLDLCDPDDAETGAVEAAFGVRLPTRDQNLGTGLAVRNRCTRGFLYLHASHFSDASERGSRASPVSMALGAEVLVTQRYAASTAFDTAAEHWHASSDPGGALGAFLELLETMSEHAAERMQTISGKVADLSDEIFAKQRWQTRQLRGWLRNVGELEAGLARSRASLLGITRITTFVCDLLPDWVPDQAQSQLATLRHDLATLDKFDGQLTDKLQFLLDAIFGFIGVSQNSVMKLFTMVSVIGVPPVLLAGIWGMNFKHMPALDFPWGYGFALASIVVSILIPLAIFKRLGWLSRD